MSDKNNIEIGKRLKELRKKNDLSQEQLAALLELKSHTTCGYWEKGNNAPSKKALYKLSKIYNVSIDYILTGVESQTHSTEQNVAEYTNEQPQSQDTMQQLTKGEKFLICKFRMLSQQDQGTVLDYIDKI